MNSKGRKASSAPTRDDDDSFRSGKSKTFTRRKNKLQMKTDDDAIFALLVDGRHTTRKMKKDGNCLFRAISDQLFGDAGAKHGDVRHQICSFLLKNREEFEPFLLMEDDSEDVTDMDAYIDNMMEVRLIQSWGMQFPFSWPSSCKPCPMSIFCIG